MINQKKISRLVFYAFIISITLIVTAAEYDKSLKLVKIRLNSRADLNTIVAMGIDIWHVEPDSITAAVTNSELSMITTENFSIDILINNLEQHSTTSPMTKATSTLTQESNRYHSYPEIVQAMMDLEESGIVKVYDIGNTIEERDILALKISDNPEIEENEPEVLLLGTHHAREWIAAEVPLYIAQQLVKLYSSDPNIRNLVDERQIWIVPVVNPDGFIYSWENERLWRKNRRYNGFFEERGDIYGVDLNRNYGFLWGLNDTGSNPDPWSQIYRGTTAFSEPESQAVRDLVQAHDFQALVTYHNYSQLILYPWGYDPNSAPGAPLLSNMAMRMSQLIEDVHGIYYTPQQAYELYPTNGTTDEWSYGTHSIPSFTVEVRPRGAPYFELPEDEILPTCQEIFPAALYIISWQRTDLNGNGLVDFEDLAILASQWINAGCTTQGWCSGADLDRDSQVSTADILGFANDWLKENITSTYKQPHNWIPAQSENWHYRKGTSEPLSNWRDIDFVEDETWLPCQTPVGYGDDDDNKILTDMRNEYSTVYLRHSFNIENTEDIPDRLFLRIYVDDGCIVSINNSRQWRFHVSEEEKFYDSLTGSNDHEAQWERLELTDSAEFLKVGDNILTIHALNVNLNSSDFSIDAQLLSPAGK